jgi:hypothetical protein
MKTVFIVLLLFTIIFPSHAKKRYSGYFMDQEFQENSKVHETYKALGVKTVSTSLTDKKRRTTRMIQTFGQDGRLVSTKKFNHKNEQIFEYHQYFNSDGKLEKIELKSDKKNKITSFEYNQNKQLIHQEILTNGKLEYACVWKYDEKGLLIEQRSFNEKGLLSKVVHQFDENNKRIKTEYFNRKNKLTHAYNYSCSNEGEKAVIAAKEKLVCSFDARENDMLIKIEETTNSKGQISRVISKYREADTVLVERNYFDTQGKIQFRTTYHPHDELIKSRETFNKSEKPWYSTTYEYDTSWKIVTQESARKGKSTSQSKWNYDGNGICTLQEYRDAKKRLLHRRVVEVLEYH